MNELFETEIGTIASNWHVLPLAKVCEPPQYGYTASAEEQGSARLLRITDIAESGVNWSTVPFCACPPELLDKYRLATGDIVFARIGATTGKSYLIANPPLSVFASYLIRVRTKREIDPAFLSLFFRSGAYWRQVDAQKNANLKKGVSGSLLKALLVPVPPLPEQQKIARVLGLILRMIQQQERLLHLTADLKKSLLNQFFTQGLRGETKKNTEIGPVPEGWIVSPLGKIATLKSGGTPSRAVPEYWNSGTIPWVKTGEINYCTIYDTEEKITPSGLANSSAKIFPAGTLLMAMYGQGVTRGKVAMLGVPAATNQACVAIFPSDAVHSKLLYYFFEYKYEYLRKLGHGANQKNLSGDIVKTITTTFPPDLSEQLQILEYLSPLDVRLETITKKKLVLNDLFRTLLHQLLTAQIRVHNLDLLELEAVAAE
jgi:type I restriction enzyme, S subunit